MEIASLRLAVASVSGRYLAWCCCAGTNQRPALFTVLADLERGEYRRLDDWWHNVQWFEVGDHRILKL